MTARLTFPAALALAASLTLAGPALAQSKKELAAKVVQLQQPAVEAIARGLAGQTAEQALRSAGQAMGNVAADKREAVGKDIQADVKKFYDDIVPTLIAQAAKDAPATLGPMLEAKFTSDELKQIITWLSSSAAKKYQQMGSEMQQTMAQKLIADSRSTVEPKLDALNESLRKRLGLPAAPPANAASAASSAQAPAKK